MTAIEHDTGSEGAERRPSRSLTHVFDLVFNRPWAIREPMLRVISDVVLMHARGEHFTPEEIRDRVGNARPRPQSTAGAVAVLPINGVIVPKATLFTDISGGTSLSRFRQMFQEALGDPDVGSIMLDIDSPGGSVSMLEETATVIRNARGRKPIVAFANTMVASAAYYLAAQADEIVGTPSALIGSVGTIAMHYDHSGQLEQDGIKVTLVTAGEHKADGNPYEPLSEGALADLQGMVDEFYGRFVRDVAKGRGTDAKTVEANYGQGRMLTAQDAVKAGMADRVDSFERTVARLARGEVASSRARAETTEPGFTTNVTWGTPIDLRANTISTTSTVVAQESEPAEPELVMAEGAHTLLGRKAVRDTFAPTALNQEGGQ